MIQSGISDSTLTFYDLIGVSYLADFEEIRRAFRIRAKVLHPDFGGDPAEFVSLVRAYRILTDPKLRKKYDRHIGVQKDSSFFQRLRTFFLRSLWNSSFSSVNPLEKGTNGPFVRLSAEPVTLSHPSVRTENHEHQDISLSTLPEILSRSERPEQGKPKGFSEQSDKTPLFEASKTPSSEDPQKNMSIQKDKRSGKKQKGRDKVVGGGVRNKVLVLLRLFFLLTGIGSAIAYIRTFSFFPTRCPLPFSDGKTYPINVQDWSSWLLSPTRIGTQFRSMLWVDHRNILEHDILTLLVLLSSCILFLLALPKRKQHVLDRVPPSKKQPLVEEGSSHTFSAEGNLL